MFTPSLVGSYFGKKVRLSTPLLKWYLEHGLVIANIYTVIEYIPNAAFNSFIMQVAQARLDGDRDKKQSTYHRNHETYWKFQLR